MIQQRQWLYNHPNSNYAAACYRYMREYAIMLRDVCASISRTRLKWGPNSPVAAVERGKRVLVRNDERLTVGDHDFTKFSLVPSVIFVIEEIRVMVFRYVHFKITVCHLSCTITLKHEA